VNTPDASDVPLLPFALPVAGAVAPQGGAADPCGSARRPRPRGSPDLGAAVGDRDPRVWEAETLDDRALRLGLERLATPELLALVLGRRDGASRTVRQAVRTIERMGGLRRAASASPGELVARAGLSPRSALSLAAALALGRRSLDRPWRRGAAYQSPLEVFDRYHAELRDLRKERFLCLLVDAKNRIVREEVIGDGGLTTAPAHPREAYGPAIREGASGVIFVHNHPSGDPEPSSLDHDLTVRLVAAGEILGVRLLDHIVVADAGYVSFLDRGVIPPPSVS